ncbi:glycoside hydrolase family 16 protein [Postia placenta MAD-698-R-SB12]|uniref:Glycoside hydrolase family 16 protein n=1 Tax=Postia placenta MAD-698-R-SB12 TaxID=670580 RepID=A0A1X6NFQ6_9APHY|nr:glycoside hydrolase family 16 protein [Postia placenta MAD-698-R-SB12]OSX67481.1 glycoside hydrolase family 16 protein [Postia placenta MAD-698-R-SB12]
MTSLGPNSQRRYIQPDSPSTTNLLSPQSRPGVQDAPGPARSLRSVASDASLAESSRYAPSTPHSIPPSISDKFSLSPDPSSWGADLSPGHPEDDDFLHNPDPRRDRKNDKGGNIFTYRGITNLGCLFILAVGIVTLFAGYPLISYFTKHKASTAGGFNLGGINASGQIPSMAGNYAMVDKHTPDSALKKADWMSGKEWTLIFSDEFDVDGRTFWPGDDPYWEAVNLHYWETNNLEWLDPTAITTSNGSLQITMTDQPKNNLNYTSGMMTTWNKFCFTGGMVEVSVRLPGTNNIVGLWPAVWTMGNLGRAGYGASLEGMWPYTYDACDVGTAPNQTKNGLPHTATVDGDPSNGDVLSYLPGQRLSRCTCPGSSHPGPMHSDGTYVGRAAPEIDIFEALISDGRGQVSQSAQWAPFNYKYTWDNTSSTYSIGNESITELNPYKGGAYQEASSALTWTDQTAYQLSGGSYSIYGIQYQPGFDDAYITWVANNQVAWTVEAAGMGADTVVEISARPVPQEPMYLIVNLGISQNFGPVDTTGLIFPSIMSIDYIRVYQDPDNINYGCDPDDFPTAAYINEYIDAYTNPNLTTWHGDYGQPIPGNSFLGQC